jgi:hypothetical protein
MDEGGWVDGLDENRRKKISIGVFPFINSLKPRGNYMYHLL